MISGIQIKNCASFDNTGVTLRGLKEINFIYGPNGSGKTTLSNVLADPDKYPQCTLEWKNNRILKTFVYNRTFIDENFGRRKNQQGIFTLGKGETAAKEIIDATKSEIEQINQEVIRDIAAIDEQNAIIQSNEVQFGEDCWKIYTQLKDHFKPAFKGCSFKNTFKDRCKEEIHNSTALLDLAVLKEKAARIYAGSTEPKADIPLIGYQSLQGTETHEIWMKRIIGKEEVDVAALIKKLGNSDWVKQGLSYYSGKGDFCPFCQQKAPENLEDQLNEYFDETYMASIKLLNDQKSAYAVQTDLIVFDVQAVLNSNNELVDHARLEEIKRMLILKIQANKDRIAAKIKEPASVLILESLQPEMELINALIQSARNKISLHNETVKNLSWESAQLTREVWRYVAEQLKTVYQRYESNQAAHGKIIEGLEMSVSEKEYRIKTLRAEVSKLEMQGANIAQTKTEINALLGKFGFTGFQLAEATEEKGCYQMIRPHGERVERTLSEGEKTVVTFLYFYHLLQGGVDLDSIHADRVVVFDDPVSNLDGDAMFMVSQLIRKIIEEIRSPKSNLKQVIVLTHDVNFHNLVSDQTGLGIEPSADETFWILRKEHDISTIMHYDMNPIKGSYELLWREVKENPDSMTLDITLRRIIETYFKAPGLLSPGEILHMLDEEDQIAARTLLAGSNAGTAERTDQLSVAFDKEHYLSVFRNIFERTNQQDHYHAMMGIG
ncbi:MAG TPA: AAA family ATPase [Prolixibacteraceae bacterium]|jgi:wobble nucleotide-excising tRNase